MALLSTARGQIENCPFEVQEWVSSGQGWAGAAPLGLGCSDEGEEGKVTQVEYIQVTYQLRSPRRRVERVSLFPE